MRFFLVGMTALLVPLAVALAAGEQGQPSTPHKAVLTGKERLGGKASDEQRIDNCKVPPALRGSKPRPDTCNPRATEPRTQ